MTVVTIALPKGRLADDTIAILERCGVDCSEINAKSRKLIFYDRTNDYRFILVKPTDVPTYVEQGVADVGVAGKDTLMESNLPLYEMLDLGLGRCKLCVCGVSHAYERGITSSNLCVATKYPNITRNYYAQKGENIRIIKLNGSVETGPLLGLSDVILDIVESGRTLRENGLEALEDVCDISARVVVNRVSLKTKGAKIKELIERIRAEIEREQP